MGLLLGFLQLFPAEFTVSPAMGQLVPNWCGCGVCEFQFWHLLLLIVVETFPLKVSPKYVSLHIPNYRIKY